MYCHPSPACIRRMSPSPLPRQTIFASVGGKEIGLGNFGDGQRPDQRARGQKRLLGKDADRSHRQIMPKEILNDIACMFGVVERAYDKSLGRQCVAPFFLRNHGITSFRSRQLRVP